MADRLKVMLEAEFGKSIDLLTAMSNDTRLQTQIGEALAMCVNTLRNEGKLLFAGNGGSAADAQHWAGELVSRFYFDRPGLPAIALTTDSSILTAIGNDYGYDYVFARQVEALGRKGDLLLAISTSGNSKNILRAIQAARVAGIAVIGFTGKSGGAMAEFCDICFQIPSSETPKIQEGHEFLGHLLCGLIEQEIFGDAKV